MLINDTIVRRAQLGAVALITLFGASACDEPDLVFQVSTPGTGVAFVGLPDPIVVTVTNAGGSDATLGEISAQAIGVVSPFALDTTRTTCQTGMLLAKSGGACQLYLVLAATQAGEYRMTLELDYEWGSGSARSESEELVVRAVLPLEGFTGTFDYGPKPLQSTARQEFYVRNPTTSEVVLGDVSAEGLGLKPPFYRSGGTCVTGQRLSDPTTGCSIGISFVPGAVQSFTQVAALRYSVANSPLFGFSNQLTLRGTGTAPVRVSANRVLSQLAAPGTPRRDTLTLTNWGGAAVTLGTVSDAALGLAAPFSVVGGTCTTGATLAPLTGSCTLQLQFSPTSVGTFTDELGLAYTDANGAAYSVPKALSSRAQASVSNNCFDTGCAAGQICSATAPGAGTCIDVPAPPPGCMAPCLWEARRHCLPVLGACTQEASTNPTLTCDLATGWAAHITTGGTPDIQTSATRLRQFGAECFSENRSYMPYFQASESSFTDGTLGIARARTPLFGNGTRNVECGPFTGAEHIPGTTFFVEQRTPECTAWTNQYLAATACRSVSPGMCSGL